VVVVTIKTESSKGFPIALQNCLQKDFVTSIRKLFPLPPDPVLLTTTALLGLFPHYSIMIS
jgi:hypothetical protein